MNAQHYKPQVFRIPPKEFSASVEIALCYMLYEEKYLFLFRSKKAFQPHTWCTPGGKLEANEDPTAAVIREIREEVSLEMDPNHITGLGPLYIRGYMEIEYVCHLFTYEFPSKPKISLSDEHDTYRWLSFQEALELPLIKGEPEVISHFLTLVKQPKIPRKSFYFIRHGQTDPYEGQNIQFTDPDLPLNLKGQQQCSLIKNELLKLPIKTVSFSPLQRAKQTKEIITNLLELEHFENHELKECNADTWMKMVRLEKGYGYEHYLEVEHFLSQALRGISSSLSQGGLPLIVAHGGIHWAICYHLSIQDHPWKIDYCKLVHFEPIGTINWKATTI